MNFFKTCTFFIVRIYVKSSINYLKMTNSLTQLEMSNLENNITRLVSKVDNVRKELKKAEEELYSLVTSDTFLRAKSTLKNLSGKRLSNDNDIPEVKKLKLEVNETDGLGFIRDDDYIVVYTDGACENNGKANAKAGIGVWWGNNHPLNISRPVDGRATNNTAEIQACIEAVRVAIEKNLSKLKIKTDSQFTINCMTQWIHRWKKNNWQLASGGDVKNKTDLVKLDQLAKQISIKWEHVAGHSGETGNEAADSLARKGAMLYKKSG